jgi:phosphoribosylformimino-5-aminoimidazole carboxamide ribotide isomerase
MHVLPVLDLLNGVVVRGVAGRRDEYRPVESVLASSADAIAVARAFRERLGLGELYLADLDAILSGRPNLDLYGQLAREGFRLIIDAGLRDAAMAAGVFDAGGETVVAGLETLAGPHELERLCNRFGADRVIFSLDMQDGTPLGDPVAWGSEPAAVATAAAACGVARMIVLDLGRVGVSRGVSTLELCGWIRARFPGIGIITGGGVRGAEDLVVLKDAGIDGVLVASALHNGAIGRDDLAGC